MNLILGSLAVLGFALLLWQWLAAMRFPLHRRETPSANPAAITLLKPLKGCDAATEDCLRSWFSQDYAGAVQILFGVVSNDDPVCAIVQKLMQEFPSCDAKLIVVSNLIGTNAKVSKLVELEKLAKHELIAVSDADVRVPPDFLTNAVGPLRNEKVGLVNCFYRLANPATPAMWWEAVAINADFWSQVLQSKMLKPLDFALGAVMVTRRKLVQEIGGFKALADCLADDYQLGNRIARNGHAIELCPVVVECWDPPQTWRSVWKHQLRWARTIRVCQPVPYFFSILSNAGLWAWLWFVAGMVGRSEMTWMSPVVLASVLLFGRMVVAVDLQRRLTRSLDHGIYFWLVPIKDLLQAAIWFGAFLGNTIEWRGQKFALRPDGTLVK
ncbi:MAG TPA: glycosyltransferase [Candidatus Paceibacterota bacterium]|nr:glycosyltransferase [Candidatus Paceibacterota bacterium]